MSRKIACVTMADVQHVIVTVAMCMLVTACGRIGFDEVPLGLGGDGGAAIDAGTLNNPDAFTGCGEGCVTGMARVTVLDNLNAGMPDVPVVVSFPDGSLSIATVTDATGRVVVEVIANSMITVPILSVTLGVVADDPTLLFTIAGVQVGDDLVLTTPKQATSSSTYGVMLPSSFPLATSYEVKGGCNIATTNDSAAQLNLAIESDCVGSQVLGIARDTNAEAIAWSSLPSSTPSPATLPAWNTAFSSSVLSAAGTAPADTSAVIAPMYGNVSYEVADPKVVIGDAQSFFSIPTSFGERWRTEVISIVSSSANTLNTVTYRQISDQFPTSASVNFATDFLSASTELAVVHDTPDRPTITWSNGNNPNSDLSLAIHVWGIASGSIGQWGILFPPGAGSSIKLPALPESLADMRPTETSALGSLVFHLEASFIDGYDAARSHPHLQTLFNGDLPVDVPLAGTHEMHYAFSAIEYADTE